MRSWTEEAPIKCLFLSKRKQHYGGARALTGACRGAFMDLSEKYAVFFSEWKLHYRKTHQPPMSQTSFYGGFDGGVGHQRVPQLHSCGPTAEGLPIKHNVMGNGNSAVY